MRINKRNVISERVILVGVADKHLEKHVKSGFLDEIEKLALTAGAVVVSKIVQKRNSPDSAFYLGKGKADEIRALAEGLNADTVIMDCELSPAQIRNLEKTINRKVIDRTELILDIFAKHARTRQASLQVELAQLKYVMPRLKRMWTHLSREVAAGGPGIGLRGPGEKQIEIDRRLANKRIKQLTIELNEIRARKEREVNKRSENITVSLVGYTNAGKSTLMNTLTNESVKVENRLFSTVDTKTTRWTLDNKQSVLLSDTVGFIRNIPHYLIESFHATLEEVKQADLLLHIVDVSSTDAEVQINSVLNELKCLDKEIILIFNKIDAVKDPVEYIILKRQYPDAVNISAKAGTGINELQKKVADFIEKRYDYIEGFEIADYNGKALSFVEDKAVICSRSRCDGFVKYDLRIGKRDLSILNSMISAQEE